MNHEQNLEKIRKACIKANPEIMELKFGCKLELIEGEFHSIEMIHRAKFNEWNNIVPFEILFVSGRKIRPTSGADFTYDDIHIYGYEILGREIQLADVLMALKAKYGDYWATYEIIDIFRSTISVEVLKCWDLTQPLDKQTPETVAFISSLLE